MSAIKAARAEPRAVNDQNVVAIGNEIEVIAPWMDKAEVRTWAQRLSGVVKP